MISTLLSHGWKKFTRSVSFSKELATNLFLAFIHNVKVPILFAPFAFTVVANRFGTGAG
jgi:hypothetical protein